MNPTNPIRHYRVRPRWLLENLIAHPGGEGLLRLCWWHGQVSYVVNTETRRYRLLSTNDAAITEDGLIPCNCSMRCSRQGVSGRLTVRFTNNEGEEVLLKIDEELKIIG